MFALVSLTIFVLIVYFFYVLNNEGGRRRVVECVNKLHGPTNVPLFGSALEIIICSMPELLKKSIGFSQLYKSPSRIWIFNTPIVAVFSPEDIQLVTSKAIEKHRSFKCLADLIGNGLITAQVDKWKRSRRIVCSAFNFSLLSKSFLDVFNRQNEFLVTLLKTEANTGAHFDLWPYIFKSSYCTINETAMGSSEEVDDKEFAATRDNFHEASKLVGKRLYMPWLQSSVLFKIYLYMIGRVNLIWQCQQLPLKILKERRKKFTERRLSEDKYAHDEKPSRNLVDMLLNMREKEDRFTDQEIADEVLTILFAGSETTAITICFALLMFAIHQDVQDKIYDEIYQIFGNSDRPPSMEDLSALTYLEQCIKETLRRFPVAPLTMRVASEDITLSKGQVIPAGVNILVGFAGPHLDNNFYPNSERWNPTNFEPENVARRPAGSFVPFGQGPRSCIGGKYAMLAIKAQLSTILRYFKVSTDVQEDDVILDGDILVRSARGYKVKLHDRK